MKIKNKVKREQVFRKQRREHTQAKLKERIERAQLEKKDPALRAKRRSENVPKTQDNTRDAYEPHRDEDDDDEDAMEDAEPEASTSQLPAQPAAAANDDEDNDEDDDETPPRTPSCKVLITTSPKVTKATYDFCDELVGVFPDSEFVRRLRKNRAFSIGNIAGWAARRGYTALVVVNEDRKVPNAITLVQLPAGPTAYFKLSSIELTKQIFGHARASPHHPELILNGFVTTLGHTVGRMFQTLFPPLPEFEGRQVVTLHNQRDFLFFRRHRYAFRSTEKVALQEIGPRFTLKLRWLKKGLPAPKKDEGAKDGEAAPEQPAEKDEGYEWIWKKELEVSRRTFFL